MFFKTQRRISVDISFNTSCTGPVHPAGEVVVSSHALVLCCVLMNPTVSWFQSSCTCGENDFQLIKMIWRYVLRLTAYTSPHTCREKELHVISLPVGKRSWSPPTLLPSFYKLPLTGDWVTVAVNAKPSVKTSGLLRQSVCVHVCARTYQPVCVCVRQSVTVRDSMFEQEPRPPYPFQSLTQQWTYGCAGLLINSPVELLDLKDATLVLLSEGLPGAEGAVLCQPAIRSNS